MPGLIQGSTAPDLPTMDGLLSSTCAQMIEERVPNLFRLYLNPYVAQACLCLTQLVDEAWPQSFGGDPCQAFLANSMEEALSGVIKLARYANNVEGRSPSGIVVDPDGRLKHFAATEIEGIGRVEYIPSLKMVASLPQAADLADDGHPPGFFVVFHSYLESHPDEIGDALDQSRTNGKHSLLIVCTDSESLRGGRPGAGRPASLPQPDLVVFDESFTNGQVPFGAFAAKRSLYEHWTKRGMTMFHSTTYQPNTISTLQLLNCLRQTRPEFIERHADTLLQIALDFAVRRDVFSQRYNRSLAKLIRTVGWDRTEIKTAGHYVSIGDTPLFDGVAGVACSIRGHNPPSYLRDIERTGSLDACREELAERLHHLTGLPHATPAVSGASAVEHALKLGLASQYPRNYVLAMRGGFGGKTLFALTGTWKPSLRQGLDPLYPHVVYVDPYASDAIAAVESAFAQYPIGVIQCELIQGVGGVRALPADVLRCLARMRDTHDCLLFVDEVQTGVFRTGPFVRSTQLDLKPDLLTIGKATSDMIFPFALTLHGDAVERRLAERGCDLRPTLRHRYEYELGLRTVLNVLRYAEDHRLEERVRARGEKFQRRLDDKLKSSDGLREVRCFGLLIGIELKTGAGMGRWISRLRQRLCLLAMMKHPQFPLLMGYCQYEPQVLKLTPPLTITEDEVESVCATISSVLQMPTWKLAKVGLMRTKSSTHRAVQTMHNGDDDE